MAGAPPPAPATAAGRGPPPQLRRQTLAFPPKASGNFSRESSFRPQDGTGNARIPNSNSGAGVGAPAPRRTFADIIGQDTSPIFGQSERDMKKKIPENLRTFGVAGEKKGRLTLKLSESEVEELVKPYKFTLIGKFPAGGPSWAIVRALFHKIGFDKPYQFGVLNDSTAIIHFSCTEDYARLWSRPLWYFQRAPMLVEKWTPTYDPKTRSSIVPVWVNLPGLPIHLFEKGLLHSISKMIGAPLRLDETTVDRMRPSNARVCVELDLSKNRIKEIDIEHGKDGTVIQPIVYEKLPPFCLLCKIPGHSAQDHQKKELEKEVKPVTKVKESLGEDDNVQKDRGVSVPLSSDSGISQKASKVEKKVSFAKNVEILNVGVGDQGQVRETPPVEKEGLETSDLRDLSMRVSGSNVELTEETIGSEEDDSMDITPSLNPFAALVQDDSDPEKTEDEVAACRSGGSENLNKKTKVYNPEKTEEEVAACRNGGSENLNMKTKVYRKKKKKKEKEVIMEEKATSFVLKQVNEDGSIEALEEKGEEEDLIAKAIDALVSSTVEKAVNAELDRLGDLF